MSSAPPAAPPAAMAEAAELLARCRRSGVELRRHGGAIGISAEFEIGEAMLGKVRELKPQLLALLEEAPSSRGARLEAIIAAAAAAFAESGGVELRTPKGNGWARRGAAEILRRMRRWGDLSAAVAARDAWRERVAIATIEGGIPEARAEAMALKELERMASEWAERGPRRSRARRRAPARVGMARPRNPQTGAAQSHETPARDGGNGFCGFRGFRAPRV